MTLFQIATSEKFLGCFALGAACAMRALPMLWDRVGQSPNQLLQQRLGPRLFEVAQHAVERLRARSPRETWILLVGGALLFFFNQ